MQLLIGTRNRDKLREIRSIFQLPGVHMVSALEFPALPEIEETGATLEENAVQKAASLARLTGCWTLADDAGLEVEALHGAPGVYSARYAGETASYEENNRKLLNQLSGHADRRAVFRCVIALSDPLGSARTVEGECRGTIADAPRGDKGFGYDPLFLPEGDERTFAEMGEREKNAISHRKQALHNARVAWAAILVAGRDRWPTDEATAT